MTAVQNAIVTQDRLLDMQRRMHEIRLFEETVMGWFSRALVRGSTHLYQGQEAVAVGVTSALRHGDTTTCTYRGHGTVLAQGAPLDRSFAEILGKANGLCGGKGGSMHLTDFSVGALGSFAIVGAHLPISVGAGWAAQLLGTGAVSATFFGDGAANIGTFHEALNLAGVWKLPVLFVIENNLYGEYSPITATTANPNLVERAASYGMPGVRIDGNDVVAVFEAAAAAVDRARAGDGPTLLEAMTYRHSGHSRSDPAKYRPAGELEEWLARDPLVVAERRLRDMGVGQDELDQLRADATARVSDAAERAMSWPDPKPEDRLDDVWVNR
ncbi:MAG TPA: thiamine pyrophosphate-dependent dehydrogenase E1 component subunit alpha [Jatrophihabitans sp.]|nr:thiamine pyrophosphate-dependent dehydrogenase E1 component subunit alpha [Jatrophihabitans sp.]